MNQIEYGFTPQYMTKNKKPWFPVMGEFHYSRYPSKYWKESIYKMKAGGIESISTYAFWIHHEEVEGEYDFSGQRDLRTFVENVADCGLTMFLRIGPWCHGEVRNGGLPDWLLQKDYKARSNDEAYFEEVERFFQKVAEQVKGLLYKDGGPIIGIQIENEFGHVGGIKGQEGEWHMKRLTTLAIKNGLTVPYYTATGWGGSVTGGLLPVMGGYCEAPWDQRVTEIEPNGNYVFTKERNDHNIGSDYGFGTGITFDMNKFPFLTAELGGGLQVTHRRRPVAKAKDIGAMSLVKLGCGVNLLGYYMYHGGTNPKGKVTTLQESKETGYPNDLPVFSYDFAAPIREFGQMSDTLKEIKLLAMFLQDFGSELCEMETYLPKSNPLVQNNFTEVRFSVRRNGKRGYLFVSNYQRRYRMAEHLKEVFYVEAEGETISFPAVDIKDQDYFFVPFHMEVGDGELKSVLATPLCILHRDTQNTYVFYTDKNLEPAYEWIQEPIYTKVLTITREEALHSWKIKLDQDYLLLTKGNVIETNTGYELLCRQDEIMRSYPKLPGAPYGYRYVGDENGYAVYKCQKKNSSGRANLSLVEADEEIKRYQIIVEYPEEKNDIFLQVDFSGDRANLYIDGEWEDDCFYTGETWEIGLKRFAFPKKVEISVYALKETDVLFLEKWPEFQNGMACEIARVSLEVEWRYQL